MKFSFLGRKAKTKEQLIDEICDKLTKKGYKWKMEEGELLVMKNDNCFSVVFWENSRKTLFRTYFTWFYSDEQLKCQKNWVLDVVTCMTNRENKHTTSMIIPEDTYCCRYECAVCNAEDFIDEFDIAYRSIGEAVNFFFKKLEHVDERGEGESYSSESDNMAEIEKEFPWEESIEEIVEKANKGDGKSLLRIGICYQFGVYGFEKDKCKAAEFYQDAMEQNNYQAMFNLAALYSNADGVAYDHDKAIELLTRIEKESGSIELIRQAHLAKKQVDNLEQVKYLFT